MKQVGEKKIKISVLYMLGLWYLNCDLWKTFDWRYQEQQSIGYSSFGLR